MIARGKLQPERPVLSICECLRCHVLVSLYVIWMKHHVPVIARYVKVANAVLKTLGPILDVLVDRPFFPSTLSPCKCSHQVVLLSL